MKRHRTCNHCVQKSCKAEVCRAEVATEDAVKGDKESKGLIENAVMLIRGIIRTINCHIGSSTQEPPSDEPPILPWLVDHAGCILSRCPKGGDGKTPFEGLHGKKPTQELVPFGGKVLEKQISTDPMNRMNPRHKFGIRLGMRKDCAESCIGTADGALRARDIRRLEPQSRWDKRSHQQCNWSTFEKDRRQMDNGQTRSQFTHRHLQEHEFRGKEPLSKTSTNSEPVFDAPVATQSKTTSGRKPIQICAECEMKNVSG